MKKFISIAVAMLIVAMTAMTAFAAGINSAEQKVLDELNSTVSMNGNQMGIPTAYVNQAESYFNTIDMTDAEADSIVSTLESAKSFLASTGASDISALTFDQKQTLLNYGNEAAGVVGLTLSYDNTTKALSVVSSDGTVVFSANPELSSKSSSSSSGSQTNNGSTAIVSDNGVVKTTGLQANTSVAVALGVTAVLFAGFATIVLFRTKKAYNA